MKQAKNDKSKRQISQKKRNMFILGIFINFLKHEKKFKLTDFKNILSLNFIIFMILIPGNIIFSSNVVKIISSKM